jgi:hypothetical protein
MKWIRERDALIAQTMAFVQSVTGRKDDFLQPEPSTVAPTVAVEIATIETVAVAVESQPLLAPLPQATQPQATLAPQPLPAPPPRAASNDVRAEMQARIANFRKHQERFEREREEYCAATLTKLRAAIRDPSPRPPAEK